MKASFFVLILMLYLISACSFTDSGELRKSENYKLDFEDKVWTPISPENADHAFMSQKTKSILVINSLCGLYQATSLTHLISNMMGGIENVQIESEKERKLVQRKSLRTYAAGEIDGVPISLIIETVRKNNCIYDFALISSSQELRTQDEKAFDKLLAGFSIP